MYAYVHLFFVIWILVILHKEIKLKLWCWNQNGTKVWNKKQTFLFPSQKDVSIEMLILADPPSHIKSKAQTVAFQ